MLEGIAPEVPPDTFRGKVVVVGVAAEGLRDVFVTPFAEGRMPGAEVHANAIDAWQNGRTLQPLPAVSSMVVPMMLAMADGKVRGMFAMGQNPAVGGQNARLQRRALAKLEWLIVKDNFETETAAFWRTSPEVKNGELSPEKIATEIRALQKTEVRDLRGREQVRRRVLADGHAGAAADTLRVVHRQLGHVLGNGDAVAVRRAADVHRHVAAGGDDPVQGAAIDNQILQNRERPGSKGLDRDRVAVGEPPHVDLAGRGPAVRTVRNAIDHQPATAADALAAVGVERDRILTGLDQVFVHDVQHFQERHVWMDVVRRVGFEAARRRRAGLPPDSECDCHRGLEVLRS